MVSTSTATYTVTGMTCEHCVLSVREELEEIAAVTAVDIDLDTGTVSLTASEPIASDEVRAAVEEAGYRLVEPAA
ncbi:heavy-metal-associated domain-containing protein [Actinomycetospora soli]|uniref:heavy-metal-associated domain-containing protein n=1 Tax=Actinomycetospora soli TaxID=2893887 RepID=UPI0027E2E20C|nr:heavy-metal-associated domain-containing protein [Actinomycetospora soli]